MAPKNHDRRYAIAAAAIQLYGDRGYDAVTAEDIAAAAGIGVRTFFRYFATKEQAAFPDHEERVERFRAALQARSGTASPVDAVIEVGAVNAREYFEQPDLYRPRYQLVHNEPALRDHERIADRSYQLAIEEFLVKELRHVPEIDLVASIVAASLVAAVNAVLDTWALDPEADATALLDVAKEIVKRSARAALAAVDPASATGQSGKHRGADIVLVLSDDPELRGQVADLVERHRERPR
jgi:AcrR family transcriptional regulator